MLRAILLLIVLIVMGRLLSMLLRGFSTPASRSNDRVVAHMVRCAHCATFVPVADAVTDGNLSYCSDAHRQLGPASRT